MGLLGTKEFVDLLALEGVLGLERFYAGFEGLDFLAAG